MTSEESNTRKALLGVATEVFQEKGFYGARMQEIADRAGLNKAMLHYYFQTKQQLFDAVFEDALRTLFPALKRFFESEATLEQKIRTLIDDYAGLLDAHPQIPAFILSELRLHPEKVLELSKRAPFQTEALMAQFEAEIAAGRFRPFDPQQFLLSLLSACIFPHISGMIWQNLFQLKDDEYKRVLQQRPQALFEFFWQSIQA